MSRLSPFAPVRLLRRRRRGRGVARLLAVLAAVAVAVPSVAVADSGTAVPARPTGLQVTTEAGSLEVSVDWDDVAGATSYLVRWRLAGEGHELSEGEQVEVSEATVTMEGSGEWVVRVEACNEAGCGLGTAKRFRVNAAAEQASEQASEPPPTTTAPPTTTTTTAPVAETLSVSVTASPAVPRPGQKVTLSAVVSNPPSGSAPSHVWQMNAGGWFTVGQAETFSYMTVFTESWTYRVTVSWDSGESATSDPITINWQAASPRGLKTTIDSASETPTTTTTPPTTTTTTVPQSVPDRPTGLSITTQRGSLDATLDWDDTDDADSYRVRWRQATTESSLNDGVTTQTSSAIITVDSYGEWVVRVEACNDAGCGLGAAKRFTTRANHPVLRGVDAYIVIHELLQPPGQGDATPPQQGELPPDTATVIVVFDQDLQTTPAPAAGQFTVKVYNADDTAAGTITPDSVEIKDKRVILELASVPEPGQYLTLDYTHNDDKPIKRATTGGDHAPSFTAQTVLMNFATTQVETIRANQLNDGGVTDYDSDYDGLIEITTAAQLNATRYDVNGNGVLEDSTTESSGHQASYNTAFPNPAANMGCPPSGCVGYELLNDIDLSGWNDGNWVMISHMGWVFEGNSHTIHNLHIPQNTSSVLVGGAGGAQSTTYGLFGVILSQGRVRNLNLNNVNVVGRFLNPEGQETSGKVAGALAGDNEGQIAAVAVTSGTVSAIGKGQVLAGGLVGDNGGTIVASSSTASVSSSGEEANDAEAGGLVGYNQGGSISASFATGSVTAVSAGVAAIAGGLVGGVSDGITITASYAANSVSASGGTNVTAEGGLIGYHHGGSVTVVDSYWDTDVGPSSSVGGGTGKNTAQLKSPTGYSGIYANWNLDLDARLSVGDEPGDDPWNFGTSSQYPTLKYVAVGDIDYDKDNDGLIEISTADQLDAIRLDTDGNGAVGSGDQTAYSNDFPSPLPRMGCPASGCVGYEIGTGRAGEAAIAIDMGVAPYNVDPGWVPIPEFTAVFDGNGNTIDGLYRSGTLPFVSDFGLFHTIGTTGVVRNLGFTSAGGRGVNNVGVLAGNNAGLIVASYSSGAVGGRGDDSNGTGGLVGRNLASGRIYASYSEASVDSTSGTSIRNLGGLVGVNHGVIVASYAAGSVAVGGSTPVDGAGGLVGRNYGRIHASYAISGGFFGGRVTDEGGLVGAAEEGSSVTASYWASSRADRADVPDSAEGVAKTTTQLQGPTGYSGIYAGWNVDLNLDGRGDDVWNFGTTSDYPTLRSPLRLAFGATSCVEELTIRDWRDLHYHRYKWSTGKVRPWDTGCASHYYTFTLTEQTQVRFHAQGRSSANLWLRHGDGYGPILAHSSRYGYNSQAARVEEILEPGTYTLETAGAHTLWTGSVTPPIVWYADLNVKTTDSHPPGEQGCDDVVAGAKCSDLLTSNTFTYGDTTYTVKFILTTPSSLTLGLDKAIPQGLTLYVGSRAFPVADATLASLDTAATWSNPNLSLAAGTTVRVTLGTSGGDCAKAIDRGQSHAERWSAECLSVSNPGPHADYYVYTPESSRFVEITLTSPDADEHVYLWEDGKQVRTAGSSGVNHAEMTWLARAGRTYVLEVTADAPSAGGRYLLAMHNGGAEPTAPPDECWETVAVEGGGPGARPNGWTFGNNAGNNKFEWPCHSVQRPAAYARYFTFELTEAREVRMELYGSQAAGADMFLREGTNVSGSHIAESHFPGIGPVRARLDRQLDAGTYTIEAVASSPGNGGHFDVVIKEPPPRFTPTGCLIDLGNITYVGVHSDRQTEAWGASGCSAYLRSGAYARFYQFELTHTVKLAFALDGGPDSRIYLYRGAEFRDSDLIEDDLSFIEQNLAPGTYTIEVTTLHGDGRSDDEYTFAYRRTGSPPPEPEFPPGAPGASFIGNVWTATLTVQASTSYLGDYLGCRRSCAAAISGSTYGHRFPYNGRWFEVVTVAVTPSGGFTFQMKGALGAAGWKLHVGNEVFTFSGNAGAMSWGGRGESLGWTAGDTIALRLEKTS